MGRRDLHGPPGSRLDDVITLCLGEEVVPQIRPWLPRQHLDPRPGLVGAAQRGGRSGRRGQGRQHGQDPCARQRRHVGAGERAAREPGPFCWKPAVQLPQREPAAEPPRSSGPAETSAATPSSGAATSSPPPAPNALAATAYPHPGLQRPPSTASRPSTPTSDMPPTASVDAAAPPDAGAALYPRMRLQRLGTIAVVQPVWRGQVAGPALTCDLETGTLALAEHPPVSSTSAGPAPAASRADQAHPTHLSATRVDRWTRGTPTCLACWAWHAWRRAPPWLWSLRWRRQVPRCSCELPSGGRQANGAANLAPFVARLQAAVLRGHTLYRVAATKVLADTRNGKWKSSDHRRAIPSHGWPGAPPCPF